MATRVAYLETEAIIPGIMGVRLRHRAEMLTMSTRTLR